MIERVRHTNIPCDPPVLLASPQRCEHCTREIADGVHLGSHWLHVGCIAPFIDALQAELRNPWITIQGQGSTNSPDRTIVYGTSGFNGPNSTWTSKVWSTNGTMKFYDST